MSDLSIQHRPFTTQEKNQSLLRLEHDLKFFEKGERLLCRAPDGSVSRRRRDDVTTWRRGNTKERTRFVGTFTTDDSRSRYARPCPDSRFRLKRSRSNVGSFKRSFVPRANRTVRRVKTRRTAAGEDVLLAVHPREARSAGDDLDRRALG